jgi:transposase
MTVRDYTSAKDFLQFKKEIRGSRTHLIVGIDIAKDDHRAFFGTAYGKTLLRRFTFKNDIEGFGNLLERVNLIKKKHGLSEVVLGMEPTANYHKPLGDYLIRCARRVVLVSGVAVKRNRELLDGRWDKNDTKDSANVADLISQGKCLFYDYTPVLIRDLKNLLSLKRRLKKQEHGLRIRIRNCLLAQYFPEIDRYYSMWEPEILSVVRWCLAPSVIAGLEYDQFVKLVCPGRKTLRKQGRLEWIWKKAVDSIGCTAGEAAEFEAQVLVEELRHIRDVIKETDVKIKDLCKRCPEYDYLLTIPGFGPDVSAKVLAAIGDPFRFNSASQVLKMAGMDLNAERSGKNSNTAVPIISKKGSGHLRYSLYQAAFIASCRHKQFKKYYSHILTGREKEKGIKTKMRVKLAAKLLVIAWTLMKNREPFDPEYLKIG